MGGGGTMTNRLRTVLALGAIALAGCSSRGLGSGGDGGAGDGGVDCTTLDEASCRLDSRCVAYAPCCCDGAIRCVAAGSSPPACNVQCSNLCSDPCKSQSEAACLQMQACVPDYCSGCSCTPTFVGCRLVSSPKTVCPPLGCPTPSCGCNGLGEAACKAAPMNLGCTAFYCPDCMGGQTYQGCLGPTQGMGACPQVCMSGCRSQSDCSSLGQVCLYPGQPLCGGACMIPPACNGDAFCQANGGGPNMICDYPQCACGGQMGCIPGCTMPSDCPSGQTCSATHHCVDFACGSCPPHFVCGSSGSCQRQTCNVDGDCGTGYCVDGGCYDSLGTCSFLPG
jgi:hypothetical protein